VAHRLPLVTVNALEILRIPSTQSKKDYLLSTLLPADIKTISVMGGCPASTIWQQGREPLVGASQRRVLTVLSLSIHERQLITVAAFLVTNEAFTTPLMWALAPLTKAKNSP